MLSLVPLLTIIDFKKGLENYERKQIYESFYEKLIEKDLIYPCFATEE